MEITIYSLGEADSFFPVIRNALGFSPVDSNDTHADLSVTVSQCQDALAKRLRDKGAVIRVEHLFKPYENDPVLSPSDKYHPNYLKVMQRSHMDDFYHNATWLLRNGINHYYADSEELRQELLTYSRSNPVFARKLAGLVRPVPDESFLNRF